MGSLIRKKTNNFFVKLKNKWLYLYYNLSLRTNRRVNWTSRKQNIARGAFIRMSAVFTKTWHAPENPDLCTTVLNSLSAWHAIDESQHGNVSIWPLAIQDCSVYIVVNKVKTVILVTLRRNKKSLQEELHLKTQLMAMIVIVWESSSMFFVTGWRSVLIYPNQTFERIYILVQIKVVPL